MKLDTIGKAHYLVMLTYEHCRLLHGLDYEAEEQSRRR